MSIPDRLSALLQSVNNADLPILSATATELAKLAPRGERVLLNDIADIVLHDPFCTLNVLRAMGQRKQGRLASEITTIEHAVMMYGARPFFERFANPKLIEAQLKPHPKVLLQFRSAMSRAHHAACQAQNMAIYHQDIESEEVYIAASLKDVGEALLCLLAPELAEKMTEAMRLDPEATRKQQQQLFGFDLSAMQRDYFQRCRLPGLLLDLMNPEYAQNHRAQTVQYAVSLARHAEYGWYDGSVNADLETITVHLRCTLDETITHVHRIAVLAARAWRWYLAPPAARWLPLLPPPAPSHPRPESIMSPARFTSVADALEWAMRTLQEQLRVQRGVFALRSRDGNMLRAKYRFGMDQDKPIARFEIDLQKPHLFSQLLGKQQTIWCNERNRENLRPFVTGEITRVVGKGDFFAGSIFLAGKPLGILYADRGSHPSNPLDEMTYKQFKRIIGILEQALSPRSTAGAAMQSRKP